MINKLRNKLVIGYSIAIIAILAASTFAGYAALSRITWKMNQKSLLQYLNNEVYESREILTKWQEDHNVPLRVRTITAHKKAFNNVVYWYAPDGRLVLAEELASVISPRIRKRLETWNFPSGEIQKLDISSAEGKRPWHFMMVSEDVFDDNGTFLGHVIVGTNMTPFADLANKYYLVSALIIVGVSLLAYVVGSYFASKAITPIKISIQKQKEFVADASHELRTPLSVLLSSIDIIKDNPEDEMLINDMKDEILTMKHLVNDLLILARSDTEKDEILFSDFDIADTANRVIRSANTLAKNKNIKIKNLSEPCVPMFGDEPKIRQLLNILIDNAIKYSPENTTIEVCIKNNENNLEIKVKDQGIGIAPDDIKKIFERFYRVDKARSRSIGGFGLGLAIAKMIVERHHGEIKVSSEIGVGSTFKIFLPIKNS